MTWSRNSSSRVRLAFPWQISFEYAQTAQRSYPARFEPSSSHRSVTSSCLSWLLIFPMTSDLMMSVGSRFNPRLLSTENTRNADCWLGVDTATKKQRLTRNPPNFVKPPRHCQTFPSVFPETAWRSAECCIVIRCPVALHPGQSTREDGYLARNIQRTLGRAHEAIDVVFAGDFRHCRLTQIVMKRVANFSCG